LVEKALNDLAKKLQGEEREARNKQRVIHDLAAVNGLVANLYVINEKAQWYGKMAIRQPRRGVSKV
jgi:hypothetical protein